MPKTAIIRARIDSQRKARVSKILDELGITPSQAINMFYAQIERRRGIPFPVVVGETDSVPPIEHVARSWNDLDNENYSHLVRK